jgi:putative hydrolase of the HAD superfamily
VNDRPAAILFDLDDTILDDSGGALPAWEAVFAEFEVTAELPPAVYAVRDWYWSDADRHRTGRADLLAATTTIIATALERIGRPDPALAATIATRYRALRDEAVGLLPGAVETLELLRSAAVPLGLITNGGAEAQRAKLERFELAPLFDYVGIEGERGFGKPDPRSYTTALVALGCDPAATWMVGDNLEWDVLAPQRHGISGIWVNPDGRAHPQDGPAPWRVIGSVVELG